MIGEVAASSLVTLIRKRPSELTSLSDASTCASRSNLASRSGSGAKRSGKTFKGMSPFPYFPVGAIALSSSNQFSMTMNCAPPVAPDCLIIRNRLPSGETS